MESLDGDLRLDTLKLRPEGEGGEIGVSLSEKAFLQKE